MLYKYVAYGADSNLVTGTIEMDSEEAAEEALWRANLTVITLKPQRRWPTLEELFPTFFGVKRRDLIVMTRQLATLLESGIAILPALHLLADQASNRWLRRILREVANSLQEGNPLSRSLANYPLVFPTIYVRMIEVGEGIGGLDLVLRQLATYMEKEESLLNKIRNAMIYPAFVLTIAAGVVVIVVTFALPAMIGFFAEFKAQLPWTTRLLIAITEFVQVFKIHLLVTVVSLAAMFWWYSHTERGARQIDRFMLTMPLLGTVNLKGNVSRFCRTMSILLRAGLPLTEIMDLNIQTTQNRVIREALQQVRSDVLAGLPLSGAVDQRPVFPKMVPQMMRVGEETGTLDANLETLANFYEEEADRAIATITALIEPLMIVGVGIVVGFIALSVIMPMYTMLRAIK
ncbi:MAG: type II secretion system F family protein [Chloroflexi bacterium]|nr:type II secretion system F family protein [Chloroflexota bacterium]